MHPFYLFSHSLSIIKKKAQTHESWDAEDYCPGKPQLPAGSFMYNVSKVYAYFPEHSCFTLDMFSMD